MRRLMLAAGLAAVIGSLGSVQAVSATTVLTSADYPPAYWIPASPSNYTVSNRPAGYQVNMIVIHDIEGSYNSAIAAFQDPHRQGSAHYVISRTGRIAQMVDETDIAWHAGNWDYNTRAIGIEHEGYAGVPGSFTIAEYQASAHLAASICSRWGVPMDRKHVIGHYQVPDPNHAGLFGGADHHWDPGQYWNWTYYMSLAVAYSRSLPSLPHMGPDPVATSVEGGATVSWQPAQTCTAPIISYSILGQPGNISVTVPASIHSVWIPGLTNGVAYSFTVTATNAQGQSSLSTNTVVPGLGCTAAFLTGSPSSPVPSGTSIQFTAASTTCNSPEYAFWVKPRGGSWTLARGYGGAAWTWNTSRLVPGTYQLGIWARQRGSAKAYEAYGFTTYSLAAFGCLNAGLAPSLDPPQVSGAQITFIASSSTCSSPQFEFWLLPSGGSWTPVQGYGPTTSWLFDSSKYTSGNFQVGVWVRQLGSANAHDSFFVTSYSIQAPGGCVVSALDPNVGPPQVIGANVTFTPRQIGCTNEYKFWLLPPGGSWKVEQAYGVGPTWAWNTAGYGAGVYEVGVWEGTSATPDTYESYAITSFSLNVGGCGSASLTPSADPPQTPGPAITFTAGSTGCAGASYQFWLLSPGGGWAPEGVYGGATWRWDTAGLAPGTYQVGVWARASGSTATYESYFIGTYRLALPGCGSASLAASPKSPQVAGTPIRFDATSADCGAPRYEFWELPPGGPWRIVQPFGGGTSFTWNSAGAAAGNYTYAVRAVATGSANTYDSYAMTTFSISG